MIAVMKRGRRIASSVFIVAALLFSQWAMASYVCAMLVPPAMEAAHSGSPGCPDMGTPNTCEQHCTGLNAATDSGKSPSLPHVTDFIPLRIELVAARLPRVAFEARRDIPPEPPPTVRYSVLRI